MTSAPSSELIETEIDERGVATLRLNRPERLNALNYGLIESAAQTLKMWERDAAVRCVVIRGNGRAFCSGDDIGGMSDETRREVEAMDFTLRREEVGYERLVKVVYDLRKPVIAAVHGHTLGAGAVLALASDIRIAADNLNMGFVFVKRGITGGTTIVARYVGLGKAHELLITGDTVDASQAVDLGLVNQMVPFEQFDYEIERLAAKIAAGPTRVIGIIKYALHKGLYEDMETAIGLNGFASKLCQDTEDSKIGREAFRNKQEPVFSGR